MALNPTSEPELLNEVPEDLKKLVRKIIRGFYSIEHALVMDLLVRNPCMKEDDMAELLKFERKQLRLIMTTLKMDKFVKVRMRVETDTEGRTTRHNFYFINYTMFVNVVKYKLHHMRHQIETDERESTNRASFKCPQCQKTYTDLEVNDLFDPMTGSFKCTYCQMEVEEDASAVPKEDARTLLAKFNEQMEPIYKLLRECEDFKLAPEILEPEPVDIRTIQSRDKHGKPSHKPQPGDKTLWSGDLTKNRDFNYSERTVTINIGNEDKASIETKPQKERPVWMVESTVEGAVAEKPTNMALYGDSVEAGSSKDTTPHDEDIMRTLLVHEKKSTNVPAAGGKLAADEDGSSTSDSEAEIVQSAKPVPASATEGVEEMETDEEEDVVMVTIGNRKVSYHDVTDSMVQQMTPTEKEDYIRQGQAMYQDMYE